MNAIPRRLTIVYAVWIALLASWVGTAATAIADTCDCNATGEPYCPDECACYDLSCTLIPNGNGQHPACPARQHHTDCDSDNECGGGGGGGGGDGCGSFVECIDSY